MPAPSPRRAVTALGPALLLAALLAVPPAAAESEVDAPSSDRTLAPPANDAFADATDLGTAASGLVESTNVDATHEAGEPDHADTDSSASVWFTWEAPTDGPTIFSTQGSDFDTVLAAYEGATVDALVEVDANDDLDAADIVDREDGQSLIEVEAEAGTTYHLAVDGYDGDQGAVALDWSQEGFAPYHDAFAAARPFDTVSGFFESTTWDATREVDEPDHHGASGTASIWLDWTAPHDGQATFILEPVAFDAVVAAYTGAAVDTLTPLDSAAWSGEGSITFAATAGTTYHVAVDGEDGQAHRFGLGWDLAVDPPANDDLAAAEVIAGASGAAEGQTFGATAEDGEPGISDNDAEQSIWWSWTAPADGTYTFDTAGSTRSKTGAYETEYDTALGVFTGETVDALTEVVSNDDAGPSDTSRLRFVAEAGTTYLVTVDGDDQDGGDVQLGWMPSVATFTDMPVGTTFFAEVEWLNDQQITGGFPDGGFHPAASVSRQAMAAFLYRFDGGEPGDFLECGCAAEPTFGDVGTEHPFYEEIEWLAFTEITGGFPDGGFHPSAPVSRQAMAAFLYRLVFDWYEVGEPPAPPAEATFGDVPTGHPFYEEIEWLASTEITGGYADGGFHPSAAISRQAMAAFLFRLDDWLDDV